MSELHIAVIDDDDLVLSATGSLLRSLGHRVALYATAEAFLDAGPPACDCVISDYRMPGRSGLDLLESLIARGIRMPFVLMTGHGTARVERRANSLGVLSLLEKPFQDEALINVIDGIRPAA